jgi:CRISPR-associated protein Cas1
MIIEKNCNIKKENLRIKVSQILDYKTKEVENVYLNPNEIIDLVLTKPSSISTAVFTLNPELSVLIFNKGKPTNIIANIDTVPNLFRFEKSILKLSKYKKRKLAYIFCKAVCSNRIKILGRLNESRNNEEIKANINSMRELDRKLILCKSREELMGLEGNIAKLFYSSLAILNPYFITLRNQEGKDLPNILLNFMHQVLRGRIYMRLIYNGLNPLHGFLHSNDRNEPFLSFDFAELWIAYLDKLAFYSVERKIVTEEDLNEEGRLSQTAITSLLKLMNKRIANEEIDNKIKEFKNYIEGKGRFSWKI